MKVGDILQVTVSLHDANELAGALEKMEIRVRRSVRSPPSVNSR